MVIFTFIATTISGLLFGGSLLASSLIAAGLSYGASYLYSYLTRPKKQSYTAVQGEVQLGGDVPFGMCVGKCRVAGHRVYYAKRGAGNAINDEVFVLSNGRCDGLDLIFIFMASRMC